jgi:opacity protein-like surface antigen
MILLAVLPACGQRLSIGVIGGGVATGGLDPAADNLWDGKRYTVGVSAAVSLPLPRISVEVDGLYKHAGQRAQDCAFTSCSYSEVRADVFEIPVLLKYRLLQHAPVAPFVGAGVSYQHVRAGSGTLLTWRTGPVVAGEAVDLTVHRFPLTMPAENHVGMVAGGGIELRAGRIRVSPELRYTRWNSAYWESAGPRGFFTASNLNQVEFLISIRF